MAVVLRSNVAPKYWYVLDQYHLTRARIEHRRIRHLTPLNTTADRDDDVNIRRYEAAFGTGVNLSPDGISLLGAHVADLRAALVSEIAAAVVAAT